VKAKNKEIDNLRKEYDLVMTKLKKSKAVTPAKGGASG
jgi:hypothetical protein